MVHSPRNVARDRVDRLDRARVALRRACIEEQGARTLERRDQLLGTERGAAMHLRPRRCGRRLRAGRSPDSVAPPARARRSGRRRAPRPGDVRASAGATTPARRRSRSIRRRRLPGYSGRRPAPGTTRRGSWIRQRMPAACGRDRRGQVAVQVDITRAGNVTAEVRLPAGIRGGEIEAAIEHRDPGRRQSFAQ